MDTSSHRDINKLLDSIHSSSSPIPISRSHPAPSIQDRLNESTERTTTEAGNLSAKAPPSSLGTFEPPSARVEDSRIQIRGPKLQYSTKQTKATWEDHRGRVLPTIPLNKQTAVWRIHRILQEVCMPNRSFRESRRRRAGSRLSATIDSTLASTCDKVTTLTVVAAYVEGEKKHWKLRLENLFWRMICIENLQSEAQYDNITRLRFIWHIHSWSKVQTLQKPRSWLDLAFYETTKLAMGELSHISEARFPNLTEIEIGVRYRSAATDLHHNYHFRMEDGKFIADTIFVPPSTRWRNPQEQMLRRAKWRHQNFLRCLVVCLIVVALYIVKCTLVWLCLLRMRPKQLSWTPTRAVAECTLLEALTFMVYIPFFQFKELFIRSVVAWRQEWRILLLMLAVVCVTQLVVPFTMVSALYEHALLFEKGGKSWVQNFSVLWLIWSDWGKIVLCWIPITASICFIFFHITT